MPDYKAMYFTLFNRITDATEYIERQEWSQALRLLIQAQREGEALYMQGDNIPSESD